MKEDLNHEFPVDVSNKKPSVNSIDEPVCVCEWWDPKMDHKSEVQSGKISAACDDVILCYDGSR